MRLSNLTPSQKSNLAFSLAIGLAIGAGQAVYRDVARNQGMLIGLVACVLVSALLGGAVSWALGRWLKTA